MPSDSSAAARALNGRCECRAVRYVVPGEHIFVGSKAPWFEITDELPQAEEY